jgi:hypothetical protein
MLTDGYEKLIGLDVLTRCSPNRCSIRIHQENCGAPQLSRGWTDSLGFAPKPRPRHAAHKGADVGLEEIYARLGELTHLGLRN